MSDGDEARDQKGYDSYSQVRPRPAGPCFGPMLVSEKRLSRVFPTTWSTGASISNEGGRAPEGRHTLLND